MKVWQNDKEKIVGTGKYQEIKYAVNKDTGELVPYVRFRNQRLWLDDFITSPHGFKEESALCGTEICAAMGTTYFSAYLIHINSHGDEAKVFEAFSIG